MQLLLLGILNLTTLLLFRLCSLLLLLVLVQLLLIGCKLGRVLVN